LELNTKPGVLQMRQDGGLDGQVTAARKNFHPTVKPLDLMRHLISLVTPEGGVVLDPFLGSGTTACAAILDGFQWVGCELTEDYWPLIEARVAWAEEEREWALINGTQLSLFDGL
jgi:DNA modification methylase